MGDLQSNSDRKNMIAEFAIDPLVRDPSILVVYAHGNVDGVVYHRNSALKPHKPDLVFTDNEYLITSGAEFVSFLQHNNVNVSNYTQIIFKSCDLGRDTNYHGKKVLSFAQDVANASQRSVLAGADLYIFNSSSSVGGYVAITKNNIITTLSNRPTAREVIGKQSMKIFTPK